jgi:hypothetical protein
VSEERETGKRNNSGWYPLKIDAFNSLRDLKENSSAVFTFLW